MNILALVLTVTVICTAFGSPSDFEQHALLRLRRDTSTGATVSTGTNNSGATTEIFGGSSYGKLVAELIENLRKAAQKAREAVTTFNAGVREEVANSRDKFIHRLEILQERVAKAIISVSDKVSSSNSAVRECINSRSGDAQTLLGESTKKATNCTDERIKEAAEMVSELISISDGAQEFITVSSAEMRNCTQAGGNFLAVGACYGTVAMKTEMKGAVFLTQSGVRIARLNLFLTTLPAALEVCAGSGLVNAGVGTAKIVMEIGSCSASSVYATFTGNGLPAN